MTTRKPFWVSWYGLVNDSGPWPWEYHGPWWVTGYDENDRPTVCAAVMASDEDDARRIILESHDDPQVDLEWRFVEERPDDWNPLDNTSGRFPPKPWMRWPWPQA